MQRPAFEEPSPLFVAPTNSRPGYRFGTVAGRLIVLAFMPSSRSPAGQALLSAIAAQRDLFTTSTAPSSESRPIRRTRPTAWRPLVL